MISHGFNKGFPRAVLFIIFTCIAFGIVPTPAGNARIMIFVWYTCKERGYMEADVHLQKTLRSFSKYFERDTRAECC